MKKNPPLDAFNFNFDATWHHRLSTIGFIMFDHYRRFCYAWINFLITQSIEFRYWFFLPQVNNGYI